MAEVVLLSGWLYPEGAAISLRIGDIDERAVSVLRFQISGRVVDAVRPGERVDEEDAV
jgi:hypothetical protein